MELDRYTIKAAIIDHDQPLDVQQSGTTRGIVVIKVCESKGWQTTFYKQKYVSTNNSQ